MAMLEWAITCDVLMMTYRGSRAGHEDQGAEVGRALVGQGSGSIDQSTDTI
jgi:hypothetical protein